MFVCLCNGITESQIRAAAANGVDSLDELRDRLGVASQCGQCSEMALSVLAERPAMDAAEDLYYAAARAP
jgi:bacterioferritin-associated ferredoxin